MQAKLDKKQKHSSLQQRSLLSFLQTESDVARLPSSPKGHSAGATSCAPQSRMAAAYSLLKSQLPSKAVEHHKECLTMTPLHGSCGGQPTPSYAAYWEDDEWLHVPRFYGYSEFGTPSATAIVEGLPMDTSFHGSLNPVQDKATAQTLQQLQTMPHGGILVLPCGYGKTVCALFIAHKLARRTLVLVHKAFLVQQWHERAAQFLPDATRGKIQQSVVDADADIVVCMVQSLSKRDYAAGVLSTFGTVVIDEAHHMSAPVFSRALRCLPARHVLGLSATPDRKDGMTCLLHYSMGSVAHRVEREAEHTLVSCILYEEGEEKEIKCRDGRISMPLMLNALVADEARNGVIASQIVKYLSVGRHIIVLTDRIVQLHALMRLLVARGIPADCIAFYIGSTTAPERQLASERRCILSTYSMANEGLDIPRLDTLVMATPKGDIVQASGRIQRKHAEKRVPLIVDIADAFSVFEGLRWKRWRFYRKERFDCQTFSASRTDAPWFL